jgi:hypothetical protein
MSRALMATAFLCVVPALCVTSALAQTPAAKSAKKPAAAKPAPEAETASSPDDNLSTGQLTMADRVLTGVSQCEFNQKVTIEPVAGHAGNFKLTFDKHTYVVQPKETTTGAILLIDKAGTIEWVQIPKKSMLMNQKEHHRMVDNCQADEQRIATQAATQAGANAPVLAPSVANPASVAALANPVPAAPVAPVTGAAPSPAPAPAPQAAPAPAPAPQKTSAATTKVVPPAPVQHSGQAPDAAASGMWK